MHGGQKVTSTSKQMGSYLSHNFLSEGS